jgi:O-antigen ligase
MVFVVLVFLIFLVINLFFEVDFLVMVDDFYNGFDFVRATADASALERLEQYISLIDGWLKHPFLGNGLGAGASYVRDQDMPWAYELFYIALLFQVGIFGFASYLIGVVWIYWIGIRIIRQGGVHAELMLPTLVGLSGYLIANTTNPYLVRFDGLWAIFLPVLIINSWFIKKNL